MVFHRLICQKPGVVRSVLRLVGRVSVFREWVRQCDPWLPSLSGSTSYCVSRPTPDIHYMNVHAGLDKGVGVDGDPADSPVPLSVIIYCILYCPVLHGCAISISQCIALQCIALYCIVLCFITLYCVVLCCAGCIVLYRIESYRVVSYLIVSYRSVAYRIASHRIALHCIVLHCIVLYSSALHRIFLHCTVSLCIVHCRRAIRAGVRGPEASLRVGRAVGQPAERHPWPHPGAGG